MAEPVGRGIPGLARRVLGSIWVHAGHLRQSGQKIAKSTGNVILVRDLRARGLDPLSFRWLCFQTQYRSEMDFTWDAMETAGQRVKQLRHRMTEWGPAAAALGEGRARSGPRA